MHLAQRLAAIVLTLGLSAGLVGCGFHLKEAIQRQHHWFITN
jgi:outer membrane lipopolysaccharide assembly protein LptE/RlpB